MEVIVNTINMEYRFKNVSNIAYDENHIAIYYYKENSCLDGKKHRSYKHCLFDMRTITKIEIENIY